MDAVETIVLFRGDIETLGFFSEQLGKTWKDAGYRVFMYDFLEPERKMPPLLRILKQGKVCMVTFNFIGIVAADEFYIGDKSIWDIYHVKCVNIMVDHPFYYHHHIEKRPADYVQFCVDQLHVQYCKRFFPNVPTAFLPLGGTELRSTCVETKKYPDKMDIVFTGNYTPPDHFNQYITRINDEYTEFYRSIIDILIQHPNTPIEVAVEQRVKEEMGEVSENELKTIMENMIFIDLYVRFHFRGKAIQTLADAGLKVHVFGGGWDLLACRHSENIINHHGTDSLGCLQVMQHATISLNVMPWFKKGAHDRIFNSMLQSAVAVSDKSDYLLEEFTHDEEILFYDLSDMEALPGLVEETLANPERLHILSAKGYQKAKQLHTWKVRARSIENTWRV